MSGPLDVATVIGGMTSETESSRKVAAFHLQAALADHGFADVFVQADGVAVVRTMVLEENGNALAYALGSLTRLLEMDMGWEAVGPDMIERAVQLVVARSSINVLRNAFHFLVLVVSRPIDQANHSRPTTPSSIKSFGINALMPMLQTHDTFLECLVEKLGSADHALCANALHLTNALMRDSIVNGPTAEWPRFINRLQELGVISEVEMLMRGDAVRSLAGPIFQFQGLTKVLLSRWRDVPVDLKKPEHRRTLDLLYETSYGQGMRRNGEYSNAASPTDGKNPAFSDHWRRLGFSSETATADFEPTGLLGMMDLSEYASRNTDAYQKFFQEQSALPPDRQCPIARASLSVTTILYEYFDIATIEDLDDEADVAEDGRTTRSENIEKLVQPLLLRWERIHTASLNSFLRLWTEAGATIYDYYKIEDLTRLLVEKTIENADRKSTTYHVELQLQSVSLATVRAWQLEELEDVYNYSWSHDLGKLREQIRADALRFVREQRTRCMLHGSWFPIIAETSQPTNPDGSPAVLITAWRFVRLSKDRRHLHFAVHPVKLSRDPSMIELPHKIDLNTVSSVDSSVSRADFSSSVELRRSVNPQPKIPGETPTSGTMTKITVYGSSSGTSTPSENFSPESVLLELYTGSSSLASEWLDGLLMLLDQQPITAETNKLTDILMRWSMKVRMLNLQWQDVEKQQIRLEDGFTLPSREGIDRDYWYKYDLPN